MKRVGLTGGIATGKSVVRAELERLGVPTIDADMVARDVVAPGTSGLTAILDRFGAGVLDTHGALDRRKLGSIVFADEAARRDLEHIIHPAVKAAIDTWLDSLSGQHNLAVAVIPLLYETGGEKRVDAVVVVTTSPELQRERVLARGTMDAQKLDAIIAKQMPDAEKPVREWPALCEAWISTLP